MNVVIDPIAPHLSPSRIAPARTAAAIAARDAAERPLNTCYLLHGPTWFDIFDDDERTEMGEKAKCTAAELCLHANMAEGDASDFARGIANTLYESPERGHSAEVALNLIRTTGFQRKAV